VPGGTGAQGPSGLLGPQGFQGPPGFQGAPGPSGPNGTPGVQGVAGTMAGPQGVPGFPGPTGPTGSPGAQGSPGPQGAAGAQGPQGVPGSQGVQSAYSSSVTSLTVGSQASSPTGWLQATGDIYAYYSDVRLKDNIETIKDAAEKLYSLNGVLYTNKDILSNEYGFDPDYSQKVGVIAQEVQKVLPEVIKPAPFDVDEKGNSKSGKNYLTVQYERIIPLIVETIKEQQKEIDKLKEIVE
jgi:hypothetical protein